MHGKVGHKGYQCLGHCRQQYFSVKYEGKVAYKQNLHDSENIID